MPQPPSDVWFRAPTLEDADEVAALIAARDAADFGQVRRPSGDDTRSWWRPDEERLATDAWLAVLAGRVVGFARMRASGAAAELEDESCVHPEARGVGIGSRLLALAEEWARERSLAPMHASVVNPDGRRLLEERGYSLVRHFWRMEIELDSESPVTAPPDGIAIRSYRPGADDAALHEMHQEAFAEHWDFVPASLEQWLRWRTRRSDYAPELWQLADSGGEIVGAALCFGERELGWVLDLAVSPRQRGQGLGLALLLAGFRELRRNGHAQVGLEVDAANETGATRLYERAGMRVTRQYDTYEREL